MATALKKAKDLTLTPFQRVVELLRTWLLLGSYIFFAEKHWWLLAIPAALFTILAGFVQMHDTIHSALGLSKKQNDLLLTLSALLLLKSGHGLKITHLRHHGQCLSDEDPEGAPARWTLKQVFLNGPYHILALRFASLRIAPNTKRIQIVETIITVFVLLVFVGLFYFTGDATGLLYWAVAFVMSSLMPLWASYIPHKMASRNPARLVGVKMARMWTPVISSFAFHHLHHTYPTVPTALLPKAARELPEPEDDDHDH